MLFKTQVERQNMYKNKFISVDFLIVQGPFLLESFCLVQWLNRQHSIPIYWILECQIFLIQHKKISISLPINLFPSQNDNLLGHLYIRGHL